MYCASTGKNIGTYYMGIYQFTDYPNYVQII